MTTGGKMAVAGGFWWLAVLAACTVPADNFSQHPGFDSIRAGLTGTPPNAAEQSLLVRHRPVLHVAAGEEGLIDFYTDYIGSGVLADSHNRTWRNPTAAVLKAVRHDPGAVFTHRPAAQSLRPAVFGGVHYATLTLTADDVRAVTFLSYHFVFRASGLPAGISPWKRGLASLLAADDDWHQLDHYTAAFVALHNDRPFAVLLQQHNYMRTYFVEEEPAFAGGRVVLDAAISSNELYPHRALRQRRRAANFMNAETAAYLTGSGDGGWNTAADVTAGGREVAYTLAFLPPDDAFYVFAGRLGEHRRLPGRDGPPGAIYRTRPSLWPLEKSLYVFYWRDDDSGYARLMEREGVGESAQRKYLARFVKKFYEIVK